MAYTYGPCPVCGSTQVKTVRQMMTTRGAAPVVGAMPGHVAEPPDDNADHRRFMKHVSDWKLVSTVPSGDDLIFVWEREYVPVRPYS